MAVQHASFYIKFKPRKKTSYSPCFMLGKGNNFTVKITEHRNSLQYIRIISVTFVTFWYELRRMQFGTLQLRIANQINKQVKNKLINIQTILLSWVLLLKLIAPPLVKKYFYSVVPTQTQMTPVCTLQFYFFKALFNIIIPSIHRSFKQFPSFSHQNPV